ncbi:MAG: hypothetical protein JWO87_3452 [Phycisphaerales bacterium]|nr:hypothetical protein [Phycisphaerales bacterium]MDB5301789.1 hypothetical protein [Phycisphaerales bacterium]MDB5304476.1 hypothetical protein [Phycisphaerales bacterium]
MEFTRITINPKQLGGLPCIRGLRIPVATVVGMVAEGIAEAEILRLFPDLEPADIREALLFAAEAVRERQLPLVAGV